MALYASRPSAYGFLMNEAVPGWLPALSADLALAGDLGITWLDAEGRRQLHHGAESVLAGGGRDQRWVQRGHERLERSIPLALGPARHQRLSRAEAHTALFFDPARPEHVSLSLSAAMSPLTWAEAPATAAGLRGLFARCFVAEAQPRARLPGRLRALVNFGDVTREDLEEGIAGGHAMIDDTSWYSTHDDDPWEGVGDLGALQLTVRLRDARREHPARIPSVSYRTLFTRSVVTIEQHPFGLWVVDIRYAPSPDAAAVRWVNEMFHARFPEDVPVDLVGSDILHGGLTFLGEVEEAEAHREIEDFMLIARMALAPGEPETAASVRGHVERFAGDDRVLRLLAEAALRYRDRGTALAIAATVPGSDLAEAILAQLSFEAREPDGGEGEADEDEAYEDEEEDDA
jgi:hypothetical protein